MGTWNSRGLRGSALEEWINHSNERYRERKLALIQKVPTPITPIRIDKTSRHITLAYFEQKSTVDYIGQYRECQYVLMQKNVQQIRFHYRIFTHTRSGLWRNLKSRMALLYPLIFYCKR